MADETTKLREVLQRAGIDASTMQVLRAGSSETYALLHTSGAQAINLWTQLRAIVSQTGYWPVLIGEDEDLEVWREQVQSSDFATTKEIVDSSLSIDPAQWLAEQHEELVDELQEFGADLYYPGAEESLGDREEFRGFIRGPWPDQSTPNDSFMIPLDVATRKPLRKVNVILAPTQASWQVPAFFRFGAWNECPGPEEHAAMMKDWQDRFGAEVVGITRDVVEMRVERPPSNKVDALRLARQHYLYCRDVVEQGTETLESLAACLLGGTSWYFWWD